MLASHDILGIEQAAFELIHAAAGQDILAEAAGVHGEIQFAIAEQRGLGSRSYTTTDLR